MKRGHTTASLIQGFTLLEMLVVLVILALLAGTGVVMLRPPSDALQLQAATRKLCASLRLARARAIAGNADSVATIDVATKTYRIDALVPAALPPRTLVTVTFAASERRPANDGTFRFFPSGGATGGDIRLALGAASTHIALNWLTGEAVCDD